MATTPAKNDGKTVTPAAEHADTGRAEDWGWHGDWGRASRVGGWISLVVLLLMTLPAQYNGQGTLWLGLSAAALFVILLWDRQRRKNSWRQ